MLNPYAPEAVECMRRYSSEFNELIDFITVQKITGVIFVSGDRHHSEVIKLPRENAYTLFDVTTSPYTSGIRKVEGIEVNNPFRIPGTLVQEQNFANVSISGTKTQRKVRIEFIGLKGQKLGEWSVNERDLK